MNHKLIVIAGPTATGKSDLAMRLAAKFSGEIICADSRTIYKGMDIGTAKPTVSDLRHVRHHMLDLLNPTETLGAAEFKQKAELIIADIVGRGHVPFLVGGSGLYINSIIYDYHFPPAADPTYRAQLNAYTTSELIALLNRQDPESLRTVDYKNRRRVIRALETVGAERNRRTDVKANCLVLGIRLNKKDIQTRIRIRAKKMLSQGIIQEVNQLANMFGWNSPALRTVGYNAFAQLAQGVLSTDEAIDLCVKETLKMYKKQMTWFKRIDEMVWLDDPNDAEGIVQEFLMSEV